MFVVSRAKRRGPQLAKGRRAELSQARATPTKSCFNCSLAAAAAANNDDDYDQSPVYVLIERIL